jgi:predicted nucleic acid-binding protein
MILADTSVWIDHFRKGNQHLDQCIVNELILMHPFVIGELACGNIPARSKMLRDLGCFPSPVCAEHDEVLNLIEQHRLFGKGINWFDAHLLASALLTGCPLWTLDTSLRAAAEQLKVGYSHVS